MRVHTTLLVLIVLSSAACHRAVQWSGHASLRSYGTSPYLSNPDPDELYVSPVIPRQHHVTLSFVAASLRSLPGVPAGDVAFGVEVRGGGLARPVRALWGVAKAEGRDATFTTQGAPTLSVGPFMHDGRPLHVALYAVPLPREQARLVSALITPQVPGADDAVTDLVSRLFDAVMAATTRGAAPWRYDLALTEAGAPTGRRGATLASGRHVLLLSPPPAAQGRASVSAASVTKYLGLRDRRIVWNHDDRPLTELPYLVVNVARHTRCPHERVAIGAARRELERALSAGGGPGEAKRHLAQLRALVDAEGCHSDAERALNRQLLALDEAAVLTIPGDGAKPAVEPFLAFLKAATDTLSTVGALLNERELARVKRRIDAVTQRLQALAGARGADAPGLGDALRSTEAALQAAARAQRERYTQALKLQQKYETTRVSKTPPPKEILEAVRRD